MQAISVGVTVSCKHVCRKAVRMKLSLYRAHTVCLPARSTAANNSSANRDAAP